MKYCLKVKNYVDLMELVEVHFIYNILNKNVKMHNIILNQINLESWSFNIVRTRVFFFF